MRLPTPVLVVLLGAAFVTLMGLGIWQLQRNDWKQNLVAESHARTDAPPLDVTDATGLGADDMLFGKGGNDTLRGENGNDMLRGDAGRDFRERGEQVGPVASRELGTTLTRVVIDHQHARRVGREPHVLPGAADGWDSVRIDGRGVFQSVAAENAGAFMTIYPVTQRLRRV